MARKLDQSKYKLKSIDFFKMKPIFYDSYQRFTNRIVNNWNKSGFKHHRGHFQLLYYAWRTKLYWANKNGAKRSKINQLDILQQSIKF